MNNPTQAALILRGQLIRLDQKCARLGAGQDERNAARDELEALPAGEREGYLTALPGAEVETPGAQEEPAKHTPGPWKYTPREQGLGGFISELGGAHIPIRTPFRDDAFLEGDNRSDCPEAEVVANAERIVLAVNCHDDLLAACKAALVDVAKILGLFDECSYLEDLDDLGVYSTAEGIRDRHAAAIAKAEGKPTC